jgi:hypothetical protein
LTPCRPPNPATTQNALTIDLRAPVNTRVSETGLPLGGQGWPFIRTKN